jgi:hypothetical protein
LRQLKLVYAQLGMDLELTALPPEQEPAYSEIDLENKVDDGE